MDQILQQSGLDLDQVALEDPFVAHFLSPLSPNPSNRSIATVPKAYESNNSTLQRQPLSSDKCLNMKSHLGKLEAILAAKSQKQQFMVSLPDGVYLSRSSICRTSSKSSVFHQPLIQMSKPLDVFENLILRVDSSQSTCGYSFLFYLMSEGQVMCETEVSKFASADSIVKFELATGRKLVTVTIQGPKGQNVSYIYLTKETPAKSLFPVIQLSGNAISLSIVTDGDKVRDPVRKRPNGSSMNVESGKLRPDSASSAYSSLHVSPSHVPAPAPDAPSQQKTVTAPYLTDFAPLPKTVAASLPPVDRKDMAVSCDAKRRKKKAQPRRMWYSNQFMMFKDPVIEKKRALNIKNYIFGSELRVNQSFVIKIGEIDDQSDGTAIVYLGFTKQMLLMIDMASLPDDPRDLCPSADWFLTGNLFTMVGAFDGIKFTRTANCISLSIESGEKMDVVSNLNANSRIFPFIFMSGSVQSLEIRVQ